MKKRILIKTTILAISAFAFTACSTTSTKSASTTAAPTGGTKDYPLDTCIVTDNKLGSMGDPITLVHEGQEVKFCCRPCVSEFKDNPAEYLSKL